MDLGGKKKSKDKSSKDKIRELSTNVENLQMAVNVSQMMLKQTLEQLNNLRQDVDNSMGVLNDFQYRTQAMMQLGNFDVDALNDVADNLKLEDYMKASDDEDEKKGYLNDDEGVVNEGSIVIITSSTNGDEDRGIFRSKFPLSECHTETLKEKLLGCKVGQEVEEEINGDLHTIKVVGIRYPTKDEEVKEEEGANEGKEDN